MKEQYKILRSGIAGVVKDIYSATYIPQVRRAGAWSEADVARYQEDRLRLVISHAIHNVPYYIETRDSYTAALRTKGEEFWEAFRELPVITKSELRKFNDGFVSKKRPVLTTCHTTSGTSGTPLRIYASLAERSLIRGILNHWFSRITGQKRWSTLALSGFAVPPSGISEKFWRDRLGRTTYLSIYSLSESALPSISRMIEEAAPFHLIYGYASAVHELAKLALSNDIRFPGVAAIVTTSEVLYPTWRRTIEKAFQARVYNMYGSQEGAHLFLDDGVGALRAHPLVGLLDSETRESRSRAVVTGLLRKTFPLIRYDLADEVVISERNPVTGCAAVLTEVGGRSEDLVRKRDGSSVGYLCFHLTKDIVGINEAQLVQSGYGKFRINLSVNSSFNSASIDIMRANLEARLGEQCWMDVTFVDAVDRGSRGKLKSVIVESFSDDD